MGKIELLIQAISFAARAHKGQKRKDDRTPYTSHPFRVCMILRHVFDVVDEEILSAAVLHDTVEDTTTDFDDIEEQFGHKIATWVGILSKDKRMQEQEREAVYFEQLEKAPDEVKLIKIADVYDNILDSATAVSQGQVERTIKKAEKYINNFGEENSEVIVKAITILESLIKEKTHK